MVRIMKFKSIDNFGKFFIFEKYLATSIISISPKLLKIDDYFIYKICDIKNINIFSSNF